MVERTASVRIALCLTAALATAAGAEIISGTSVMKLNTPANAQIRNEALGIAADSLKSALYHWLHYSLNAAPDVGNPVKKHFFSRYAAACIKEAKQDSYFEGREWTLNLDIKDEDARRLLAAHNARCDSIASESWRTAQQAVANKQYTAVYSSTIRALFYSLGKLGEPEGKTDITPQARAALQEFMKSLKVSYSTPILKGKLGEKSETDVTITATVGETPFPGLVLLARLPDGTHITTLETNEQGIARLANITMPFVAYGTFLHVVPDFGAIVDPAYSFEADAFGITLGQGQDQTLIFNIVKPVYTLEYAATAASKMEIPPDFATDGRLRSFIEDSLHLQPQSGKLPTDIVIDIQCQVSSYTFDEREETDLKVEVKASVKQNTVGGGHVERTELLHKKTYDSNHPIPKGLFFWEATNKLKGMLKEMLARL
ncbi:MAG: hypothetical protein GF418_03895 [Chitinivibrionales bacterium]|nr:hypothetical protein [Chitinivibrionales bacterium]MBD3394748.1 hypothetical protein [Chitinivibrionales bacterium]